MPFAIFHRGRALIGSTSCPTVEQAELQTNPWADGTLIVDELPEGGLATWEYDADAAALVLKA
jgi:hypothetical protein